MVGDSTAGAWGRIVASVGDYMTEREVVERTTLSQRTLQRYRSAGGGPTWSRLGRRVVYRWADVEAWIRSREVSAA